MAGTTTMQIIDPWATKVVNLGVLLLWHYIHFIVNICYFLLGVAVAVKSYLISTGVLRKYNVLDLGKLRYLAVVIDSEEARQTGKVIKLLQWLAQMGVRRACLYDPEGVLDRSKDVILGKLNFIGLLEDSTDDKLPADEKKLILEVASKSDGKEAVARAANLLLVKYTRSKSYGEDKEGNFFSEERMTEALKAVGCRGPEPDLLLVYGPARCHLGFPAWRLRYTEIVHMGSLKSMKYGSLINAIYMYTLVRQNYGSNHARNNPEDYWKEVMKDQPMPDAIKDLLVKDGSKTTNDFVRDFDVKPNVIIYLGNDKDRMTMNKNDHRKRMNIVGDWRWGSDEA